MPSGERNEMKPTEEQKMEPCRHMTRWVSALSDGSLSGIARWYTRWHIAGCPKCAAALTGLRALRERLRLLASREERQGPSALPEERWTTVEAAMDAVDTRH